MPPPMLIQYILTRITVSVAVLFLILSSLILVIDLIENMRFAGKIPDADFAVALQLTFLRLPGLALALTPFVFLFGGIWMFMQLNQRSEISVMRAAGLSVWRLIGPPALLAALFGLFSVIILDPATSRFYAYGDEIKNQYGRKTKSLVDISEDGIWLRQRAGKGALLLNAQNFDQQNASLHNVTAWRLDETALFIERIDADYALLSGETIELHNAKLKNAQDREARNIPILAVSTTLTSEDLGERVVPPETMSIWQLPRFTMLAEAAGLPTKRYEIRFHDLCTTPLKLVAMILIAAIFSLRPWRQGGGFRLLLQSIGAGFALYILSEIFIALGMSGAAPVALAAWTPPVVAALVAVATLLQLEDG